MLELADIGSVRYEGSFWHLLTETVRPRAPRCYLSLAMQNQCGPPGSFPGLPVFSFSVTSVVVSRNNGSKVNFYRASTKWRKKSE